VRQEQQGLLPLFFSADSTPPPHLPLQRQQKNTTQNITIVNPSTTPHAAISTVGVSQPAN